jgi:hypothetical protein
MNIWNFLKTSTKKIHNCLKNVPSKNKWHPTIDSNSILPIETKDNNILELQGLLKHNGFINTLATKIIHAILIYVSNKHYWFFKS